MRWLWCLCLLLAGLANGDDLPPIAARAYVLLDQHSGSVLVQRAGDQQLEPASLTKLMTAYLVFQALHQGKLSAQTPVAVSAAATAASGELLPLVAGEQPTVEQLLQGMITVSANDAAIALAEAVAGSEAQFVAEMNSTAQRLGLANTHFNNADGHPQAGHYSSALDLARLASALIRDFPEQYPRFQRREFVWQGISRRNTNLLLWRDPTVDGLKTGTTLRAGYCLAASSVRGQRRVVAVLLGASSEEARAVETQKLLNYGMSAFETPRVYHSTQVVAQLRVWEGAVREVNVIMPQDRYLTVAAGDGKRLQARFLSRQPLLAPVRQGQQLGQVVLSLDGHDLASYPAVAADTVLRSGWLGSLVDRLRLWFNAGS